MSELFEDYPIRDGVFDEMFGPEGLRDTYEALAKSIDTLSDDDMRSRSDYLKSTYLDQGVTFDVGGEERPFPLDIVPRIIAARSWTPVVAGVKQRIKALDAFLSDVYGAGHVINDGVIPRRVVTSSPHFHRVMSGYQPPNGVHIHISGVDLIRDGDGIFRVLEDNVRIPSGVSYVMTNRRALSAALPEVFNRYRISPVRQYAERLLTTLRAAAPSGISNPNIVVMTPGVYNSAYFEHALLARMMGVELVEGRDLVCQNGQVRARTTRGLKRVHVIYRRVDDDYLDPVHFRKDSMLGVAGLVNATKAGNVTLANGIGNGVADDKLVYTYVPDLIRYYLGEEPMLASVDTWRLEDPTHREEVMDRLHELVVKPVDGSGGKGVVIGPAASKEQLEALRQEVNADPRGWIAQPVVQLSTVPTMIDGRMQPRHVDLRPFALNDGNDVWVLPGGLTRVALPEGELIVNSSRGGGSKDTWISTIYNTHPVPPEPEPYTGSPRYPVARAKAAPPPSAAQSQGDGSQSQTLGTMTQGQHMGRPRRTSAPSSTDSAAVAPAGDPAQAGDSSC